MFNHQYNFNIEIPAELISAVKHDQIFEHFFENKVIIGLVGYARSGKDTIAKKFIDGYGYRRVAFADNIKIEMNQYLKEKVFNDFISRELEGIKFNSFEEIDFFTEDISQKVILRPYIIWYGEKLRQINGPYYWVNKAMEIDAFGHNNIILSDVRRSKELDIFINSNSFKKRSELGFNAAAAPINLVDTRLKSYSSLLFHVNQLNLEDEDILTNECIRIAQESWMIDHTFYIDPRLPSDGPYRNNSINYQIKEVVKKFGILSPDKKLNFPGKQMSILD